MFTKRLLDRLKRRLGSSVPGLSRIPELHPSLSNAMAEQGYLSDIQVSFMDSFLKSVPKPNEVDLLPSLGEEVQSPCVGQDVNFVHLIPGPGGVVTVNGDNSTVQILQEDNLDTEVLSESLERVQLQSLWTKYLTDPIVCAAARKILCREIIGNAVTVMHFRRIMMKLRDNLLQAGEAAPHKVLHREAYARVLMRLSERLTSLDSESALSLRPLGYIESLNKLIENIESGFVIMKQSGIEPDVFIMKDKEPVGYSERLCSLASYLISDY